MIKRRKAELKKLKEDTRTRAIETFLRELYPEKHPNSPPSLNSQINALGKINVNDLKEFQKNHLIHFILMLVYMLFQKI